MRNKIIAALIFLLFVSVTQVVFSASVSVLTLMPGKSYGNVITIINVQVSEIKGQKYLGCSYIDKKGNEINIDAKTIQGSGNHQFTIPASAKKVIISLWEKKVFKKNCHNGSKGRYCKYCKDMGYHMETQLATTGWLDATKRVIG
ncbi:hypothetical protein KAU32_12595 [bacterium]|nr:hypothetical protein [bacterium]